MLKQALITGFDLSDHVLQLSAGVSGGQRGHIPADLKATPEVCDF